MEVIIGIASSGRNEILKETLRRLSWQTRKPDAVVVCLPNEESRNVKELGLEAAVLLKAPRGSCSQRNCILNHLHQRDAILMLMDDDLVLHREYLAHMSSAFEDHPNIAIINGQLLKDGIIGPGLTFADADLLLSESEVRQEEVAFKDIPHAYGCNMAVNLRLVDSTRFDENLPLYGWQEDVDWSARVRSYGRVVQINRIAGVHLGVKSGRVSGVRFGYSQVVNPVYLLRKRTMTLPHVRKMLVRNVGSNLVRVFRPEPYIDRKGRLLGNCLGLIDLLRGRAHPKRVLDLDV